MKTVFQLTHTEVPKILNDWGGMLKLEPCGVSCGPQTSLRFLSGYLGPPSIPSWNCCPGFLLGP
jgi:hypothetical protein